MGIKQGIKQGIEQGIERGVKNTQIKIAIKMLVRNNQTLEEISEIVGKRQVICWIENHFKKIDNYIEN